MRPVLFLCAVGIVAAAAPALAAHAPDPGGAATATVSGYRASDVSYTLDARSPGSVAGVSFLLAPATARTVRVRAAGAWATCRTGSGRTRCTFGGSRPRLADLRALTILATA
jgi:hypothetical protein